MNQAASSNTESEKVKVPAASGPTQLLAAGFNAHGQLSLPGKGGDITTFTNTVTEPDARLLYTSWSSTDLLSDNTLIRLGHDAFGLPLEPSLAGTLTDAFGDENGMLGCLDTSGRLYLLDDEGEARTLECLSTEASPSVGRIAKAGNGKVAISFKQAPAGRLCHVLQFDSLADFLAWFYEPSIIQIDAESQHFMMQGRPIQLIANTATFMLLMESGEVYTWGDPRYQSLGRTITGENSTPAERPGLVEGLAGMKIQKIACGGWMCAALSEDKVLYIWGTGTPGTDRTIKLLAESDPGELIMVDLMDVREPLDVYDVAVGDNHIAAIGEDLGEWQLWVAGENMNGQLGMDSEEPWVEEFVEVESIRGRVRGVVCGPKSTFITTATSNPP